MIKRKRGSSHIEVVFSFILFFGFVLFLFSYFKPYKQPELGDASVLSIYSEFNEMNQVDFTKIFIKVKNSWSQDCFSLNIPGYSGDSIVTSALGGGVQSSYDGDLDVGSGAGNYYVLISSEFAGTSFSCSSSLNLGDYEIGSIETREVISSSSLQDFLTRYSGDYEGLKTSLKIPARTDFAILSEDFEASRSIPNKIEVLSKSFNLNVLYPTGEIKSQEFIIKVW